MPWWKRILCFLFGLSILFLRFRSLCRTCRLGTRTFFQFSFWDSSKDDGLSGTHNVSEVFQFSFWDSKSRQIIRVKGGSVAFNSLFEIQKAHNIPELHDIIYLSGSVAFNSLFEIPGSSGAGASGRPSLSILFLRFLSGNLNPILAPEDYTFNSLFEIREPRPHHLPPRSRIPIAFNSLFEIRGTALAAPQMALVSLSILFLRFLMEFRIVELVALVTFNSLFEIHDTIIKIPLLGR